MSDDVSIESIIPPYELYDFYGIYSFSKKKINFIKAIYTSKDIQILMFKYESKIVLMKRFVLCENYKDVLLNEFQTIGYFTEYKIITLSRLNKKIIEIIFVEEGTPLSEVCALNENSVNHNLSILDIARKLLNAIIYYEFHKINVSNLSIDSFFYIVKEGIEKLRFVNLNVPSDYRHISNLWANLVLQCKNLNFIEELSINDVDNNQDLRKKFLIILKNSIERPIKIKLLLEIIKTIKEESIENIEDKLKLGKDSKECLYKKIDSLNISIEQYKKQYQSLVMEYLKLQGEIDKSIKKISKYSLNNKISLITEIVDCLLNKINDLEEYNKEEELRNKEFIEVNFKIQKNSIEDLSEKLDNAQSHILELNQTITRMKKELHEYEQIKEILSKESKLQNNSCLNSLNAIIQTVNNFDKNLSEAQKKANESISKYLDEKQIRNQDILKISKIIAETNKILGKFKIKTIISNIETLPQTINEILDLLFEGKV